ncbi:glycosyltransferase family 4 protein [Methylomonas sp. MgM2]
MTNRKHIAYFTNQYPAVSHTFIRREIRALERLGWQVSRFAIRMHPGGVVDSADLAEVELTQFIVKVSKVELLSILLKQLLLNARRFFSTLLFAVRFDRGHAKNPLKTLICLVEACVLAAWCKQQGIEHLHVHFGTNPATIALFARCLGGPSYSFTVHGPEEFDKPEMLGLAEKIKQASFVVAISSFGRSQLYRWADFADWEKIKVVHCGLAEDFLNHTPARVPDEPRLVCVGRLSEQKGQMILLQALARLVGEGLVLKLVMVGDGPLRKDIERFITDHQLQAHVELTGSLSGEQVRGQLSGAKVFVLPSFAEGLPVVIMEAFALGRPVISTYVAGIPELVTHEGNGWLVPAGSVDALASAIRDVLHASPDALTLMGKNGRQRVLEDHNIIVEAKKLSDLFSSSVQSA